MEAKKAKIFIDQVTFPEGGYESGRQLKKSLRSLLPDDSKELVKLKRKAGGFVLKVEKEQLERFGHQKRAKEILGLGSKKRKK
tara:strand:+ start:175 stop:423 length:249 start_codon:yes stop_codon:yes gene_type:complete